MSDRIDYEIIACCLSHITAGSSLAREGHNLYRTRSDGRNEPGKYALFHESLGWTRSMVGNTRAISALTCSAKIPVVLHGSITHCLIFHRYIEQNSHFKAIAAQKSAVEKASNDADRSIGATNDLTGLGFCLLSEADLMSGHVVKERIVRLLDHPSLNNHLLRARNLLSLLVSLSDLSS